MQRKRWLWSFVIVLSVLVSISCGGNGSSPSSTTSPGATVAATTAPNPTSAAVAFPTIALPTGSTPVPGVNTGTILDKALPYFPFELENVRYGGTFRYGNNFTLGNLDPKFTNSTPLLQDAKFFYEKLLGWLPNPNDNFSHLAPMLAEKWTASADLKEYTFHLRKGVRFHNLPPANGREMVADDVVYSHNRYREKDSISIAAYSQVTSIEAPDKYTVVFKLKETNAWALNDLFAATDYILPREFVEQSGGTLGTKAIGTGPYILEKYTFRQGLDLVKNPSYWDKDAKGQPLPYTDAVQGVYITDFATSSAAFRTGQLDSVGLGTVEALIAVGKTNPDIRVYDVGLSTTYGITFNTRKAPWNDVRVRRAINMSLDKEKYAQTLFTTVPWTYGTPMPWNLISDEPFTFEKLGPYYKYNPEEAKRLLIEAGFDGGKVKINTTMYYAHPNFTPRVLTWTQLLKDNGIEYAPEAMDFATYGTRYYQRSHEDVALTFQNTGDWSVYWFAMNKFHPDASQNTAWIKSPEIDSWIQELRTATDPIRIRQIGKLLWDFDTLGSWNIWTPNPRGFAAVSPRTRNWTTRSSAGFTSLRILPWLADAPRTAP